MAELIDSVRHLDPQRSLILAAALLIAFGFEVVNGFHDAANAVTTVIYTRTMRPILAVLFSGLCNFLGVMLGGTAIAFSIVHLLPVDLLIQANSTTAIVMVLALLVSGMAWNLSTWWLGLPVSSSHTLIGSILGIGMANGLLSSQGLIRGVNWAKSGEVGLALLISPLIGFVWAAILLLTSKRLIPDPELYVPPPAEPDASPPWWIRAILVTTCGGVSLAHGSNDGQKGMGLIMLVLIGLLPSTYALDLRNHSRARDTQTAAEHLRLVLATGHQPARAQTLQALDTLIEVLDGKHSLREVSPEDRLLVRSMIFEVDRALEKQNPPGRDAAGSELERLRQELREAVEYVPTWVIISVALCLGIGTTIGYRRIVITVAEKIGKTHLTYAQGASAELVAMATIGFASIGGLPVSTTHVLSSGVAGTMWANESGIQMQTLRTIGLAWALTLPASMILAATLFFLGHLAVGN
jgi:phosphate/sulfate permease